MIHEDFHYTPWLRDMVSFNFKPKPPSGREDEGLNSAFIMHVSHFEENISTF